MNNWIKKHVDTVVVLGAVVASVMYMNNGFNSVNEKIYKLDKELALINKEVSIIKAILIIQRILPPELALEEIEGLCAS